MLVAQEVLAAVQTMQPLVRGQRVKVIMAAQARLTVVHIQQVVAVVVLVL